LLWEIEAEDIRLIPVLGEMIAVGLGRGNALRALTLNASNVTVQPDTDHPDHLPRAGDYVALTIKGLGDWRPEWLWPPGSGSAHTIYSDVEQRLRESGAVYAYARLRGYRIDHGFFARGAIIRACLSSKSLIRYWPG
jgi:hypothetical protein